MGDPKGPLDSAAQGTMLSDDRLALDRALAAHAGGRRIEPGSRLNLDRYFNGQLLLEWSKRLPLGEITSLLAAAKLRENGLAEARAGHPEKAEASLRQARNELTRSPLSEEALLMGQSFQHPAEAYLHYRQGKFEAAKATLTLALEECASLRDRYGYPVEVRRVHIGRNIARVEAVAGQPEEALRLVCLLIGYLDEKMECWPFSSACLRSTPDPLEEAERLSLLDQLLGEVVFLAGDDRLPCLASLEHAQLVSGADHGAQRAASWWNAWEAHRAGQVEMFLAHAAAFFIGGRAYVEQAWDELEQRLLEIYPGEATNVDAA